MIIRFHKTFLKQLRKLNKRERQLVEGRLGLFIEQPFDRRLRNHVLKGSYSDYRSIDIRPDLRAIYKEVSPDEAIFVLLGNHNQLYK